MPAQGLWTDPCGVPVRIMAHRPPGPLQDFLFAAGVAWTLWGQRRHYQLVYFLMQGLHLAAGLPVARLLGKPIVMKVSGSSIITNMLHSSAGRLELRWLRQWAYRVMILNSGMEEEAFAAGFRKDHLCWMPNPVDTAEFAPLAPAGRCALRQEFGIPPEAAVVVFVGRLAPEKELPSLLGAFVRVAEQIPEARLVLVGDGPERTALAEVTSRGAIADRVYIAGREPAARVLQWLQLADVFALVSSNEGLSCSLVEAMSVGLASVVSAIPANVQLIDDGIHGLHAPVRDEEALAAALMKLLCDAPLRARVGQAARQRVLENYSIDRVVDRYEELFQGAMRERPR
jgi:glycosyltransferase involved in cell wall biosynthesis